MGAPQQLPAKELGDPSAPPHSFLRMLGSFLLRIIRLETPFRLFTSTGPQTLGGSFIRRCRWSSAPSNAASTASKSTKTPRFKRKGPRRRQLPLPGPKQIQLDQANSRLSLPKLGYLRYRNSREVLGELRNVTVSQAGGKWFASIQTQREVEQPLRRPPARSASM